jgi:sensor domain CHASE-containing protein
VSDFTFAVNVTFIAGSNAASDDTGLMPKSIFRAATRQNLATSPLRPLLIVAVAAVVALVVGCILASRLLLNEFNQIEQAGAIQRASLMLKAFEADISQLSLSNRDYAEWDTAQQFIINRDYQFITENFTSNTLKNLRVDIAIIVGADNSVIHAAYFDRQSGKLRDPFPVKLLEQLQPLMNDPLLQASSNNLDRVINTEQGAAAITVTEIRRSDKSQPTGARMLFGRFILNAELQRFRGTSQLNTMGVSYLQGDRPVIGLPLGEDVSHWIRAGWHGVDRAASQPC